MRTFRCPACGCTLEMPQEKDFDAIRCAECRELINRSFFDRRRHEREDDQPRRRPPKLWRFFAKKIIRSWRVDAVEEGLVVRRSALKTILRMALTVFFFVVGLAVVVISLALIAASLGLLSIPGKEPQGPKYVVLLVLGPPGGLLLVCGSVLSLISEVELWRRGERLVLGKTYFQCLIDKDRALFQLPFDQIADLSLGTQPGSRYSLPYSYIGIDVKEDPGKDVIFDDRAKQNGFDVVLCDIYELPLHKLFQKLLSRWRRVEGRWNQRQERELRSFRRRAMIGNTAAFILLGLTLSSFCCLAPLAIVAKMVGGGGNNAGFNGSNDLANLERLALSIPDQRQEKIAGELAERANSPDFFTRQAVIKALAVWATPKELPVLINALNDNHPAIREAALKGLGRFRDERALSPVLRCFEDFFTRGAAEKALIEMGPMAEKGVLALLGRQGMKEAVVRVLGQVGTQQSVPALEALRDDFFLGKKAREAMAAIAARSNK
jgi:hypothetical protein